MLPPVILLHGCGGSPEQTFERTGWIDAFGAAGREVAALRLPGHGRKNPSRHPAAYADLADSVVRELPETADLVGFSLGAKVAIAVAVRWPGRVRKMVLGGIGDNAFAPEAVGEAAARALEHGADASTPPAVRAFLQSWDPSLNDPQAIAAVLRRPANPVLSESEVEAIRIPVVVANGAEDFVTTLGRRLFEALAVEPVLLPGVGHFDLTEQAAFRDLAVNFLED